MIVYFSGTGNSRWCAQMLAKRLEDELLDAFHYLKDGIAADLSSAKPWVFVCPTYAWQLPRIFVQFLRSGSFQGNRDAYFVMTCGSDIGNAPAKNQALCQELGLVCRGTLTVVMPENYIAMFPVPGEEEARAIRDAARPGLEAAARHIAAGRDLPGWKPSAADRLKSGPVNRAFYPMFVKSGKFTVSDACIHCGKCADQCVTGSIRMVDGRPQWGEGCTHCMACICGCPVSAIEYGRISQGKPRYQCPPWQEL